MTGSRYEVTGGQEVILDHESRILDLNHSRQPETRWVGDAEIIVDGNNTNAILPTHKLSGLPLLVLPIAPTNAGCEMWVDYDHGNYPRMSRELRGIGGVAVRCSRGQDLPRWLHKRKHNVFLEGPMLPRSAAAKYMSCVLACADFVPRQAIDLTCDGGYDIVEMSDAQIQEIAESRTVHVEDAHRSDGGRFCRNMIGKFFAYYAVSQNLNHVSPHVIEQFLGTTDETRKKELGYLLLSESLDVAMQPVRQLRRDLKDQGLVQLRPRDPHDTVRKFFVKSRYPDYIPELHTRLEKAMQAA